MFARLSMYEHVDVDAANGLNTRHRPIPPRAAGLPRVDDAARLDRENARLVGIGVYASDAEARESEKLLPPLLENAQAQVPDASA